MQDLDRPEQLKQSFFQLWDYAMEKIELLDYLDCISP